MKKYLVFSLAASCTLPLYAVPPGGGGQGAGRAATPAERLERMDTDGSGDITLEEFQAAFGRGTARRFERMDTDGNGSVSKAEYEDVLSRRPNKNRPRQPAKGKGPRRLPFEEADQNGDGGLTLDELTTAQTTRTAEHFERLDVNEDGVLSTQELPGRDGRKGNRRGPPEDLDPTDG